MMDIWLGSLFDGIGAFPYAASLFGVKTAWASEILPAAVSVTRRHFPDMQHVGDITKLDGAALQPVEIVAFGSPCQDLSQAAGNKRVGLAGERSGLFREAIRIINEMRCATNGRYPRYAIFENVIGCMSSNSRRDFAAVLEAFAESEIPMPRSGKWANAGLVRGRRANLAWCIYNAADFGLAQRRKRLFLIADFGKGRPEEILLVPKSLPRHFTQGIKAREGATAAAESGAHSAECRAYGICSYASNSMKSANSHSGVYEADTARTLDQACGNPACNQGGMAVVELPSVTMRIRAGCEGGGKGALLQTEKSGTLATGNDQYLFCNKNRQRPAYGFDLTQITSKTNRSTLQEVQPSLCAAGNPHVVHPKIVGTLCASAAGLSRPAGMASEPDLSVAHATFSRQRSDMFRESDIASTQTARQCKEATDLCVYCLQGNMIGRSDENGPRGSGVQTRLSYTLTATDTPAVAAVDCRNLRELDEISGTLQAKKTAGYSLNYQNPIRTGYIVRRLTPTECEKLMGFDVGWTAYGHDGKEISDSRRYSMLGNSIATPCAAYIIQGILEQYAKEGS